MLRNSPEMEKPVLRVSLLHVMMARPTLHYTSYGLLFSPSTRPKRPNELNRRSCPNNNLHSLSGTRTN